MRRGNNSGELLPYISSLASAKLPSSKSRGRIIMALERIRAVEQPVDEAAPEEVVQQEPIHRPWLFRTSRHKRRKAKAKPQPTTSIYVKLEPPLDDFGSEGPGYETDDEEGNKISPPDVRLPEVLDIITRLEEDICSLIFHGRTFTHRRDRNKRRKKLMGLLDALRTDLEFNDFLVTKKEQP
jgi:hypothetical protein